ncbi:uncharacterized protein LOC108680735 [Hyalella azteca]|uniref:Uncharacterized protein LOC108680735 n=1 Tax=Hyalella azteca TaxID=294128 RepID=A0A8B7PGJ1_HYAAZ|nr:uncharacterized protein LOC108680735 [Hyalella azteca]
MYLQLKRTHTSSDEKPKDLQQYRPRNLVGCLISTLLVMVVAARADANADLNPRMSDDSTPHSAANGKSDAPGGKTDPLSRTAALVEEMFGPSAVVEADESRRIYAISIPGIYPDDGQLGPRSAQYQPPVYHSRGAPGQAGAPFSATDPARPPHSSHDPNSYWKSGLRLIVSGPVDDGLPIAARDEPPSFDYSHSRHPSTSSLSHDDRWGEFPPRDLNDFIRELDYRQNSSPHGFDDGNSEFKTFETHTDQTDQTDARIAQLGSRFRGIQDFPQDDYKSSSSRDHGGAADVGVYEAGSEASSEYHSSDYFHHDGDARADTTHRLPSAFVSHGESTPERTSLSFHQEDNPPHPDRSIQPAMHDTDDVRQINRGQYRSGALAGNENLFFNNQPYPKLAAPRHVLSDGEKENSSEVAHVEPEGTKPTVIGITKTINQKVKASGDNTYDGPTLDYYDSLYEEFMQSAYPDYSDHPSLEQAKYNRTPSASEESSLKAPLSRKLVTPENANVDSVTRKDFPTRRDPPSDIYTTSKSTIHLPDGFNYKDDHTGDNLKPSAPLNKDNLPSLEKSSPPSPFPHLSSSGEKFKESQITNDESTASPTDTPTASRKGIASNGSLLEVSTSDTTSTYATTQQTIDKTPHPYLSSPTTTAISLSEVLQNIGLSLPQFLVQLKIHKMDLKQFTNKLEKRSLTQAELKRAKGNLGTLLEILDELPSFSPTTVVSAYEIITTPRPTYKKTSFEPRKEITTEKVHNTEITSPHTTTERTSPVESLSTSSESSPLASTTSLPTSKFPKRFGFKPSADITSQGQFVISANITSVDVTEKDATSSVAPESADKEEKYLSSAEVISKESEEITYRPYRREEGNWRDRMKNNRGLSSRLGTTTRRPTVRPPYAYYGGETDLRDLIDRQSYENSNMSNSTRISLEDSKTSSDNKENNIFLSKGESTVIGLTEGTPLGGAFDHPRYDRDPNSLNIATRSAIMAAGVLGGVALAVFITIFVFVMYRNHVGRRRLRVPFPVSIASDESGSSSPALYSNRSRLGLGHRASGHTDFWGTLRKKFDPYSLNSSTASYY